VSAPAGRKLAILAGGGPLPRLLADAAAAQGRPVHILAFDGFCEPETWAGLPHDVVPLAKVGRLFAALAASGSADVVLAGPVRRPKLRHLAFDLTGLLTFVRLLPAWGGDASLLARVLRLIEARGYRALGAHDILPGLLAPAGPLGRHAPDAAALADISAGFAAARTLGAGGRGQAVLVRGGHVVAREDRAGTAALLRTPGAAGAILVKAAMPGQDRRVDLPTIGPQTVAEAVRAGLRGIAVEAGETLVLERARTIEAADAAGLFVHGIAR
jgi:DUF1009 family protein